MAIQNLSGRAAAIARRDAQQSGKTATPTPVQASVRSSSRTSSTSPVAKPTQSSGAGRAAALARRDSLASGKIASSADRTTPGRVRPQTKSKSTPPKAAATANVAIAPVRATSSTTRRAVVASSAGREASQARRQTMSAKGKKGAASTDRNRVAANTRSAPTPAKDCGCGCNGRGDCADSNVKRVAPSAMMSTASDKAKSNGKRRSAISEVSPSNAGRMKSQIRRQALATHGKSGVDAYRNGISSAQMLRQQNPEISGRELARSVRTQRSNSGGTQSKGRTSTGRRRPQRDTRDVSGTKVSHSDKTTGDEMGLCRDVTGTEYFSSEVFADFCQSEAPAVPAKVATSESLSGNTMTTSSKIGRSQSVTGDEQGSCLAVTGCEYVGREQYDDFCQSKPEPGTAKVSFSQTTRGQIVSGSKSSRSKQMTGDEAGTCSAITGTPYTGVEHFESYCRPEETKMSVARNQNNTSSGIARDITGIQPGFSGLTGAGKGACSDVSGSAYVGSEDQQGVCEIKPAQTSEPDFPQPLNDAPWGAFSVLTPKVSVLTPKVHASQSPAAEPDTITGTSSDNGRISGTFSMGEGKVTGTEQFRFGDRKARKAVASPKPKVMSISVMPTVAKPAKAKPAAAKPAADKPQVDNVSRVTGEGLDRGLKITGNDWDRGEHVTGTEGTSAVKRNPTRRGPISAMHSIEEKREAVERNDITVTGGSGTPDGVALVTLSGGARG